MESFNQVAPWIAVGVLFAVVIFFCMFYITRLLKTRISVDEGSIHGISNDQKRKLKDEIVHDIVADITPVLEKRIERAF